MLNQVLDRRPELGGYLWDFTRATGDDQRDISFIDQRMIGLVYDGNIQVLLDHFSRGQFQVVPHEVEPKFPKRAIHDRFAIGDSPLRFIHDL